MSLKSCKDLVRIIASYFHTFHSCIVKKEYDYLNSDPPLHKHDRCSSTVYVILRLIIGKQIYKKYKEIDSLYITRRHILQSPYDSYNELKQFGNDILNHKKEHVFFSIKIVRLFDGVPYSPQEKEEMIPCHYFLIEKKSNGSLLTFNLYQSYVDHYSLCDYLTEIDPSRSREDVIHMIKSLEKIFSSNKWTNECSSIWNDLFLHKIKKQVIGLPLKNQLFFTYQVYPIVSPKRNFRKFIEEELKELKHSKDNSLFDLPSLFKDNRKVKNKEIKEDLKLANKCIDSLS